MFGFSSYHILLTALGLAIVLAYWLPRFVSGGSRRRRRC
jgi:hypothetical protein